MKHTLEEEQVRGIPVGKACLILVRDTLDSQNQSRFELIWVIGLFQDLTGKGHL